MSRREPVSAIACRPQIESALAFLSQHMGVGPQLVCGWDRTGGQEFPLLQNGDWSAANLFGRSGRFDLSVQGLPALVVSAAGFAYRIVGEDVLIDPDVITFKGLAARLGPAAGNAVGAGEHPVGMDPLTIGWSVFSVLNVIWQIMHPKLDLVLGGNVSCALQLESPEKLVVTFQQMPSVRVTVWFEMLLGVTGVEITPSSVKLLLHGEGFIAGRIKERTFEVN